MSTNLSKFRNIHSIAEVESVSNKNGVIYLDKPVKYDVFDFLQEHPNCDALTVCGMDKGNARVMHVVAYAAKPENNEQIRMLRLSNKDKYGYFSSVDLEDSTI